MLRHAGLSYKTFEESGLMLVVRKMTVEYVYPAEFDDELTLITRVVKSKGARIEHSYLLARDTDGQLIVRGQSEIACIDRKGVVKRLPDYLQFDVKSNN